MICLTLSISNCRNRRRPKLSFLSPPFPDRGTWRAFSFFLLGQSGYMPFDNIIFQVKGVVHIDFFSEAINTLSILVVALGAGLGVWGVINLLEGYGSDNPGANAHVSYRSNNDGGNRRFYAIRHRR